MQVTNENITIFNNWPLSVIFAMQTLQLSSSIKEYDWYSLPLQQIVGYQWIHH